MNIIKLFCFFFLIGESLYIGMLRHCTVTAVKTNITRVSCPSSEGRTKPGEDRMMWVGDQWAVQGFTDATDRKVCASFTTVYVDF